MTLDSVFRKNKNIIINTDIDGFLSGMILQKYYGCRIVGLSNSWDCVWIDPEYEASTDNALESPVYIDLYVAAPSVICIEQHIIGYDEEHNRRIASMQTKINPNLMRPGRTFSGDYFHKYPFGTVHFLIALMEREGIHVELPLLHTTTTQRAAKYGLTAGDILLRADDALFSSLGRYKTNTDEWWPWLLELSGNAESIRSMIGHIGHTPSQQNFEVKRRTGDYFTKEFHCSGTDGAFKNITDNSGNLLSHVLEYSHEICQMMGMALHLPKRYNIHKGIASTMRYQGNGEDLDTNNTPDLYSYAFIYGRNSPNNNLSYTIRIQ